MSFFLLLFVYICYQIYVHDVITVQILFQNMFTFVGGSFLMCTLMSQRISDIQFDCRRIMKRLTGQKYYPNTLAYVDKAAKELHELDPCVRHICEYNITSIRKCMEEIENMNLTITKEADYNTLHELRNVAKFSLTSKLLTYSEQRIVKLLQFYHRDTRMMLSNLIRDMIMNSHVKGAMKEKVAAYLYGIPGTGKSYFVHKLLKILNVQCFPVVAKTFDERNFAYLYDIFVKAEHSNYVIFIDEIDKIPAKVYSFAQQELLELCENSTSYVMKYLSLNRVNLDLKYNINGITVLVCGNDMKFSDAMRSRAPVIEFKDAEKDVKRKAMEKHFVKYMRVHDAEYVLQDEHERMIGDIVDKDTWGGIRVIKYVTTQYARYVLQRQLIPKDSVLYVNEFDMDMNFNSFR